MIIFYIFKVSDLSDSIINILIENASNHSRYGILGFNLELLLKVLR